MLTQLASEFGVLFKRCACLAWCQMKQSALLMARLPPPPEVAQRLPGNAVRTVEMGTHRVRFSEGGEITPLGATKA